MERLQTQEILDKIEMMKQIVIGFTDVISKENDALKVGDDQTVKVLYEQKLKTVAAYRSLTAFFIKNRAQIAEFVGEAKDELKELSINLDKVLKIIVAGWMRAIFRMRKMTVNAVMPVTPSKIPPQ